MGFLQDRVFALLESRYNSNTFWKSIEEKIRLNLISLPSIIVEDNKRDIILIIDTIKNILRDNHISDSEIKYIDEKIKIILGQTQVLSYQEELESVDKETMNTFLSLAFEQQGVIAIPSNLNYKQVKSITKKIYREQRLLKFFVTKEKQYTGMILPMENETAINLNLIEVKNVKKEEDIIEVINFFDEYKGEKNSQPHIILDANVYTYNYVCEGKKYILISFNELKCEETIVWGMNAHLSEIKGFGKMANVKTRLPVIIVHSIKPTNNTFNNPLEFNQFLDTLDYGDLYNFPFSFNYDEVQMKLLSYEVWFKDLIWAWLLHSKKGIHGTKYPLHLQIYGPPGSGKSTLIESLNKKVMEKQPIYSGTGSTFKALIPSFAEKIAKPGYLVTCNRFAFCDEFLRSLLRSGNGQENRNYELTYLNDLLEHRVRETSSANCTIKVSMKARILIGSNPLSTSSPIHDMVSMVSYLEPSFLSRTLILWQNPDEILRVKTYELSELENYIPKIECKDFVSIINYLHQIDAKYDINKVNEIYFQLNKLMPSILADFYLTRHKHHIECIMDGIVKTRCLLTKDMSFTAIPEDYIKLHNIWNNIIRSWNSKENILELSLNNRYKYLPYETKFMFEALMSKKVTLAEIILMFEKKLNKNQIYSNLQILVELGFVRVDMDKYIFSSFDLNLTKKINFGE
jgi:hypothetical protein